MSGAAARELLSIRRSINAIRTAMTDDFLAHSYRNYLYGGWRHESGRWVTQGHVGLQKFHEACRSRFCAFCNSCKKHRDHCECGASQDLCWAYIGPAPVSEEWGGEGEVATRKCRHHGEVPWRKTLYYTTIGMIPANKYAKEVPVDTPVLTPTGWRRIGDLSVGDEVLAGDGTRTKVTGVFPQGIKPVWRLTFADGASCLAGADHQWKAKTPRQRFSRDGAVRGKWSVLRTRDILAIDGERPRATRRCTIPLTGPVDLEAAGQLPLDPYLVGLLLGDGGLSGETIGFTSADSALVEALGKRLPPGCRLTRQPDDITWRIVRVDARQPNPLKAALGGLGLAGKLSNAKRVPRVYMTASPANRLLMLQGLMDTDGTVSRRGFCDFTSVSRGLAEDVRDLARSLGGLARLSGPRKSHYTKNGVRVPCQDSYQVHLKPTSKWNPFLLERKAKHVKAPVRAEERVLRSIEPAGEAECVCIAVAHPDSTYILNDYIVTHNTAGAGAQFSANIIGHCPWDGALTLPVGSGRIHLVICQTFATSALLTIAPLLEKYLKPIIIRKITSSSGTLSGWIVRASDGVGTDIVKLASQDQHYRTTSAVSPLEGVNPIQLWWDEPMEGGIRGTATRGLLPALGLGAGVEMISATLLEGSPKAATYIRSELWDKAWVNGGNSREMFAMTGTMWENPAYTAEEVRQTLDRFPPWEREARAFGTAAYRRGLIIPDFQIDVHTWEPKEFDPLVDRQTGEPSAHPIYMAVDPHDVRPWMMKWVMLEPGGYKDDKGNWIYPVRVVREWPEGAFRDMRHFSHAEPGFGGSYKDYARIIERVESGIPGGKARIMRRFMDPAFGDSLKMGSNGQTVAKQMREQGYYFVTDIPREVEPGHNILRHLVRGSWTPGEEVDDLHKPHLLVARNCTNLIWAFLNYVNDEGSNPTKMREKPGEAGKDDIDCLRYILVMRPHYCDWRTVGREQLGRQSRLVSRMNASRPF